MLIYCGIEANLEKCRAISEMRSFDNVKKFQKVDRSTGAERLKESGYFHFIMDF